MNQKFWLHLISLVLLSGCSQEIPLAKNFVFPAGTEITIERSLSTSHADKKLIFDLVDIPDTKKDRDFSDYLNVKLIDTSGKEYNPEKIWDINGMRRDIIADCKNIPKGTKITTIKIRALKGVRGTTIRWWAGKHL